MGIKKMFVKDEKDLISSVNTFYNASPQDKKKMVGTAYQYFVHVQDGSTHKFGFSKFCAFKGITPDEYMHKPKLREKTDGTTTQMHIRDKTGKKWLPLDEQTPEIQKAFKNWISGFLDNPNLERIKILSI